MLLNCTILRNEMLSKKKKKFVLGEVTDGILKSPKSIVYSNIGNLR